LKLTIALLSEINKPFGVIVNKAGIGDNTMMDFLKSTGVPILGTIPYSKRYAAQYAKGALTNKTPPEIIEAYQFIIKNIHKHTGLML
ncbi:MAG: hypothetical protein RQ866_08695, partial [Bacteroidales bacterium]|nr:hypothetical protein [Bacteroidales bacterium]